MIHQLRIELARIDVGNSLLAADGSQLVGSGWCAKLVCDVAFLGGQPIRLLGKIFKRRTGGLAVAGLVGLDDIDEEVLPQLQQRRQGGVRDVESRLAILIEPCA